jgi:hypothetical protein
LLIQNQGGQIVSQQLELNQDEFKRNCSYLFEISESKLNNQQTWSIMWFLNFHNSFIEYDFELKWGFIENKFDHNAKKIGKKISFPLRHGFNFNDAQEKFMINTNELEFSFKPLNSNRKFKVYFDIRNEKGNQLNEIDMAQFLNKKILTYFNSEFKKFELFNTLIYNRENPFSIDRDQEQFLRIKRSQNDDVLYSEIKMFFRLDSMIGDCDFDKSLCDYSLSSAIQPEKHLVASSQGLLVNHVPKHTFLNTLDSNFSEKANDYYLTLEKDKSSQELSALYSPLIKVQSSNKNSTFNTKAYSISFKYTTFNSDGVSFELNLFQNRSDVKNLTTNIFNRQTLSIFNSHSLINSNQNIFKFIEKSTQCDKSENREQYLNWINDLRTKSDMKKDKEWFQVNRLAFFSCYDFRVMFLLHPNQQQHSKNQIGLDDIKINEETQELIKECEINSCQNNGRCYMLQGETKCCCLAGFKGEKCEEKIDLCGSLISELEIPNVCQNNGTCINMDTEFDYMCKCSDGFTGKNCEIELDECASNPCKNNAECVDLINSYACVCKSGFNGRNCQFKKGTCSDACNSEGTWECLEERNEQPFCVCKPNYEGKDCSKRLVDDVCTSDRNPCADDSECQIDIDSIDGFKCICPEYRTGKYCETKINFCSNFPSLCQNGSVCVFANQDASKFVCSCEFGLTGAYCNETIDHCASNPCVNGVCTSFQSGFECNCFRGWHGKACDKLAEHPCYKHKCVHGNCVVDVKSMSNYTCTCHQNTQGDYCELNKCSFENSGCDRNGTLNVLTSNTDCFCMCKPEYTGAKCEHK